MNEFELGMFRRDGVTEPGWVLGAGFYRGSLLDGAGIERQYYPGCGLADFLRLAGLFERMWRGSGASYEDALQKALLEPSFFARLVAVIRQLDGGVGEFWADLMMNARERLAPKYVASSRLGSWPRGVNWPCFKQLPGTTATVLELDALFQQTGDFWEVVKYADRNRFPFKMNDLWHTVMPVLQNARILDRDRACLEREPSERRLAVAMALHARLGRGSALRELPVEVVRAVLGPLQPPLPRRRRHTDA